MALKDIVLHADANDRANMAARLEVAVDLAREHGARLTGVFVITPPDVPAYIEQQIGEDILKAQAAAVRQAAERVRASFEKAASAAELQFEWRLAEGYVTDALSVHGRYGDLVVTGQVPPGSSGSAGGADMPGQLALSQGRPVLVVPYVGRYPRIGHTIVVAWDASRSAARALGDAMALMEHAKSVTVLSINPEAMPMGHGDVAGMDICQHLARHGIKANAQRVATDDVGEADMILSRIADLGADMLVMGAYGHARWRELMLGGVTRHMLAHMTVPVLLSH
jgi:nucleotide-binding universal stress UspA family protein